VTIALLLNSISEASFSPVIDFLNFTTAFGDPACDFIIQIGNGLVVKIRIGNIDDLILFHCFFLLSSGLLLTLDAAAVQEWKDFAVGKSNGIQYIMNLRVKGESQAKVSVGIVNETKGESVSSFRGIKEVRCHGLYS